MTIHFGIFKTSQQIQATSILQYDTDMGWAQAVNYSGHKAYPNDDWIDICVVYMTRQDNDSTFILEATGSCVATRTGSEQGVPVVRLARGSNTQTSPTVVDIGKGDQAWFSSYDISTFTHTTTDDASDASLGEDVIYRLQLQCDRNYGWYNIVTAYCGKYIRYGVSTSDDNDYNLASLTVMEVKNVT